MRTEELNIITIDRYFDEMELSEKEKGRRKEFAYSFEEIMFFLFSLFLIMRENGHMNEEFIVSQIQERYLKLVEENTFVDSYIRKYISKFSKEITDTTLRHGDEEFFVSPERALIVSENEGNNLFNYVQYREYIERGFRRKRWRTEKDDQVRKSHREVEGVTIPIDSVFVVGNSLMRFPKDTSLFAETKELAGCRCTIEYLR